LITDVRLAGLSGIEVALHIREQIPSIPVVLMSGYLWDVENPNLEPLGSESVVILQSRFKRKRS
jgi:CheY-like chemotaxis protein